MLVVDHSTKTRQGFVSLLEGAGFAAVGAASGMVAIYLFQAGFRPCVVVLEVNLPTMDGWMVWKSMQAHADLAKIPVVILSTNRADDARARAVGIREVLRKPVDGAALVAAVDRHCDRQGRAA